jgi:hypothetical protein
MNFFAPSPFQTGAFQTGVFAALALGCALPVGLSAGEAIQFSNARSRQDPTAKSKLPGDKEGEGLGRVNPLDYIPSQGESTRRDPARERKARNAAAERAYWMVLDRGQLDAQDEEKRAFGIRDASFEKESDHKDYFFAPLGDKEDQPGRPRSPFTRASGRDRSESDAETKDAPAVGGKAEDNSEPHRTPVLGKDGQPLGDHTARELDLKDLLNSSKANSLAPVGDRTALLWKEVLGSSGGDSGLTRRRDEATGADSFRGSVSSGPARSADSFTFRNDLNTRAAAAMPSSIAESGSRSFSLPAAAVAPRVSDPGFGRGPGLYGSPAGNDPYAPSAGGVGPDPYPGYRTQPQRPASGNFQIPARPGYGGR